MVTKNSQVASEDERRRIGAASSDEVEGLRSCVLLLANAMFHDKGSERQERITKVIHELNKVDQRDPFVSELRDALGLKAWHTKVAIVNEVKEAAKDRAKLNETVTIDDLCGNERDVHLLDLPGHYRRTLRLLKWRNDEFLKVRKEIQGLLEILIEGSPSKMFVKKALEHVNHALRSAPAEVMK